MAGPSVARRWEAILLAAGASLRMGFPKALLRWEGIPMLAFLLRELEATRVRRIHVVLGAGAEEIRNEVERAALAAGIPVPAGAESRAQFVYNPSWHEGKSTSIRAGAEALRPDATDVLLLTVDQPVRAEVLEALMGAHERLGKGATLPVYGGKRGHPVALSARYRRELASLSEERQGLRELVCRLEAQGELAEPEIAAPCVRWNLNRAEDVARVLGGRLEPVPPPAE